MAEHGWLGPIEWAATSRPRPGEKACGDRPLAIDVSPGAALFGVLDGLGHGGRPPGQRSAASTSFAKTLISRSES